MPSLNPSRNIRRYKRKNKIEVQCTKNGKKQIANKKLFSEIKKHKFHIMSDAISKFTELLEKKVFIKKCSKRTFTCDKYQLEDYLKQKRFVKNIPEIYGYIKIKNKAYIFSKHISNSIPFTQYIIKNPQLKNKYKKQIKQIGKKLLSKRLLPWDFKLRQFFVDLKSKKIYFADNAIACHSPTFLKKIFLQSNNKVPKKLEKLSKKQKILGLKFLKKGIKKVRSLKEDQTIFKKGKKLDKIQKKLRQPFYILQEKMFKDTISFYKSLSKEKKTSLQKQILKNCLEEFKEL